MVNSTDTTRGPDVSLNAPPSPAAGLRGGAGAWSQADAGVARAGHHLRRLRYFRDLLAEGFRTATTVDLPSSTLRAERVDLGIDLPELDAVALWSTRRHADGAIAIPFVEFILGQVVAALDAFCSDLGDPRVEADLIEHRHALEMLLREANRGGAEALRLPSLNDNFLPEPLLARACGPGGWLERTLEVCEGTLPGLA